MNESAQIMDPRAAGGLAVNSAGEVSVAAMRPWVHNGRTYITEYDAQGNAVAVPVTNAGLLQKDEWIAFDETVRRIATRRRALVGDLESRGLVFDAGDLGSTIAEWESASDMTAAEINMDGGTMTEEDAQAFSLHGVPIPIIRKDFRINQRRLLASRRMGQSVDTTQAATASRLVMEAGEDMLINGWKTVSAYTVYGYTNHPQRETYTIANSWTDAVNRDILGDVEAMLGQMEQQARHFGPYMLYVSKDYWAELRADYKAESERTFLERIRAYAEIEDVKVSDFLPDDTVLMVQLDQEVVDLARAQGLVTVQWSRGDGMVNHFAIMEAWAPRLKPDYENRLGILHATI